MSDGANRTNVLDDAVGNFVPVEATTVAPPNGDHPMAVVATTDVAADAQPADEIAKMIPTMQSVEQIDEYSTNMNPEDIQKYDGSLEMLLDEQDVDEYEDDELASKLPADDPELAPDKTKQKQIRASRLKFKDQGILATSSVYLQDDVDKEIAAQHCSVDNKLKGVIVEIPSKKTTLFDDVGKKTKRTGHMTLVLCREHK